MESKITIMADAAFKASMKAAAKQDGQTLSGWLRHLAARRIEQQQTRGQTVYLRRESA